MTHKSIYLVGLMAVGKSTVGKLLAEKLKGLSLILIKKLRKMPARRFLGSSMLREKKGFRDREEQVIGETFGEDRSDNRNWWWGRRKGRKSEAHCKKRGTVIHLDCPNEFWV
ncbi:MAG: hypothetical protein Ct9H90mP27_5410 [Gammaproteobacteria bacterium]|nr:MAG: hypothetical protein Ct9H90mP27_5410 [Gammaproteobacteria bacterium]